MTKSSMRRASGLPDTTTLTLAVVMGLLVAALCLRGEGAGGGPIRSVAGSHDILVYGGTPGGIAAAVTAARSGRRVALVEYHGHLGGMSTSGLGKSDVETREAIGGIWREFKDRIKAHYGERYGPGHENVRLCRDGYYYEPSVAELVFNAMVGEQPGIDVFLRHELASVERSGNRIVGANFIDRATKQHRELRASVFIDATYEGDLAAYAGAAYRLGRESRREFNELHAGVVYMDHTTRTFLTGTTGDGDERLQAYTFRLCLTSDPANSRMLTEPPPDYDRARYLGYLDDWREGRLGTPVLEVPGPQVGDRNPPTAGTLVRAFSIAYIPNGKTDVNMFPRALAFPFVEENAGYPEADWSRRERIIKRIRNLTLGLLWFLQNDDVVPPAHRDLAKRFNLSKDEFTDNDNFPWQLYVREARRIIGEYTLSEQDLFVGPDLGRTRIHADSIAAGEYPIDSFPTRKREKGHDVSLEGYILMLSTMTRPYQIPYRIIVPKSVDGLLVPVAASTTHVAFSSIRLEPTWMVLGQAAAVAADHALQAGVEVRNVDVDAMQRELLRQGQVLTYFKDIDPEAPEFAGLQYFGTKGFFPDYEARASDPLDARTARDWLVLALGPEAAVTFAAGLPDRGNVTMSHLQILQERTGLNGAQNPAVGDSRMTRGAFCRLLYAALPDFPNRSRVDERTLTSLSSRGERWPHRFSASSTTSIQIP